MKRRHRAVYNRDTKVQLAMVCVNNNAEKKAVIIDHLRNIGFVEDDVNGDMHLSVGVFNSTPTKYSSIKKLIAGNFTSKDSDIIDKAILGVNMKAQKTEEKLAEPQSDVEKPDLTTELDLEREIACYNHAVDRANQVVEKIDNLISTGVPKEYVISRYPDIKGKLQDFDSVIVVKRMRLADAVEKKTAIKSKIEKLKTQLQVAEYDEYLKREEYIITLQSCTEALDFDESVKPMLEEDLAELNRLKRIKELEEELVALKSKSKFPPVTPASTPSTPAPAVVEKPVVELEVELPTEKQDKEIRFLSNHLYQVRRGNEEHNPTICRRIAALSAELKLTKSEFCRRILSISVQCWDDRHRKYFTTLGLHLHGERHLTDSKSETKDFKNEIKRWTSIHIIASDGNELLNHDVYDAFIKDTGSDITKISFYNVMARTLGYKPKCKYRRDENGKTRCDTYYIGYRIV